MHRTLKAETTRPPAPNRRAQQQRFNRFRHQFNYERPHEARGLQPPIRGYSASPRSLPRQLEPLTYPGHFELRRVHRPGVISWHSRNLAISTVLIGETIGFEPVDDGEWDVHFGPIRLGRFDERMRRLYPAPRRIR